MPRYFLELAYKGTAYSGFQVQENANTIQAEVQHALEVIFRTAFALTGSSRTDAGVHALQNYFHFDTELAITDKIVYNLNALLPATISVKGVYRVPADAHCRFDAVARAYTYYIYKRKNPFMNDRGWMYPYPVNINLLNEAAGILRLYNDFTSFSKRNTQVSTFLCAVEQSEWCQEEGGVLVYRVKANRFLRGMVRGLVGTMLKVGRAQISPDNFRDIIEARNCTRVNFSTPPQGLFLTRIFYNEAVAPYLIPGEG